MGPRLKQAFSSAATQAIRHRAQLRHEMVEQCHVAGQRAAIDHGAQNRGVGRRKAARIAEGAHALSDIHPRIEEILKQLPSHIRHDRTCVGIVQEHDVEIGIRRHFAAAIPAVCHEHDVAANPVGGLGWQFCHDRSPDFAHHAVEQVGGERTGLHTRCAGGMLRGDCLAEFRERLGRIHNGCSGLKPDAMDHPQHAPVCW